MKNAHTKMVEFNGRKYFLRKSGHYESQRPATQLHRDIYEFYYKITIPKGYVIHHIDHDPTNNDIENLVMLSISDHSKLHNANRTISDETKKIWSEQRKGRVAWNKGKKLNSLSEEHKNKLSEANKKPITNEMIEDVKNGITRRKFHEKYNCVSPWVRIYKQYIKGVD